jgi:hypothetical protein
MARWLILAVVLVAGSLAAREAWALGSDFTKEELAAAGKHCVHGYWVNEQTVTFYAGDTAQLNRDLARLKDGDYASRKVVLHAGTKRVESPWDKQPREMSADWSVNSWDDPADAARATPRRRLRIDVWLGDKKVQEKELRIPKGFEVGKE